MKHKNKWFLFIACFVLSPVLAQAEVQITQNINGVYYRVTGNQDRSFYPANKGNYLYEGSINIGNVPFRDYEFFANFDYRTTDDRLVDAEDFSIQRMYMGLKGRAKEILIGDFYQSFSEYSLGNALKGLQLFFGDEDTSRFIFVGGLDVSRWEELWKKRQDDSPKRTYVWGMRLENDLMENNKLALNFNYGGARDDSAYVLASASPVMVNVFSIDTKYKISRYLDAFAEIAQSFTDADTRDGSVPTKSDMAQKVGFDLRLAQYDFAAVYSRIGNHFNTTGGFAAQDLETMSFDGLWFLPLRTRFVHYLRMDRDNLSATQATTTRQLNPGGRFSFSLPWELSWDIGADMRKRYSNPKTTNQKTYAYITNFSRDFKILFARLGYTRTMISDRISPAQERSSDTYTLSLDGSCEIKEARLSWNIGQDITRDAHKEAGKSDFIQSTSLGAKLVFPSTLTFEGRVRLSDNDYYLDTADSKTTDYYFAASRSLRQDLSFALSYSRKGYRYFDRGNNYAEQLIRANLTYKF